MRYKRGRTGHLDDIIEGLIKGWEKQELKKGNAVFAAWQEAVGEETTSHARPVNFKKGEMVVVVENSAWLYKLTMEKREITEKFNEKYTGKIKLRNIRFRIGSLEHEK